MPDRRYNDYKGTTMSIDDVFAQNFSMMSDSYRAFAKRKHMCRKCDIYDNYQHVGQSEGNAKNPTFMFIGEALGADEVSHKRPFIGRAGQRLRTEIRKYAAFTKETCLISNVLSCRPPGNKFPRDVDAPWSIYKFTDDGNRVPLKVVRKSRELINHCATNWVRNEIKIVRPKVVVPLGGVALDYIRGDRGVANNRGTWKFLPLYQAWSFATFHPSYVLRNDNEDGQHVVEQFEQDIAKIAKTWRSVVDEDPRMQMSHEEWQKERTLADFRGVDFGLLERATSSKYD